MVQVPGNYAVCRMPMQDGMQPSTTAVSTILHVKLTGILDEYVVRLEIPVSDRRLAVVRIVTEYRAVQVLQAAVDATHRLKGI